MDIGGKIMLLTEFKQRLKGNNVGNLYIFTGDEWQVQKIYLQQICKIKNAELRYIDSIQDITSRKGNSLLSKRYVYYLIEDKDIMTNEKIQKNLNNIIKDNVLILKYFKPLKTSKYKDKTVEFTPLKEDMLIRQVSSVFMGGISESAIKDLVQCCDYNYGRLILEIDKVKHYNPNNYEKALTELISKGLIYCDTQEDVIFPFIDSIMKCKIPEAYMWEKEYINSGGNVMAFLTLLYNNVKATLQVKTCTSSDVAKCTGLASWMINKVKPYINVYSEDKLISIMLDICKCQKGIITGKIPEAYVIDYIIIKIGG